jgi:alpha-glucosidase
VFVRAGTILPRQALVQSTSETPKGALQLDVYPGDDCRGELYFDDGIHVAGPSLRQTVRCAVTPKGVSLTFGARAGNYRPWWKQIAVTVHGAEGGSMTIPDQPRAKTVLIPAK